MSYRNNPPRGPAEPPAHRTPRLTVPREQLAGELEARVAEGQQLRQQRGDNNDTLRQRQNDYTRWHEYNETLLRQRFDSDEPASKYAATGPRYIASGLQEQWNRLERHYELRLQRLVSLGERLALFDVIVDLDPSSSARRASSTDGTPAEDVFIVHGHDGTTKTTVARFLTQLTGRAPVILHERADGGRTIIETFEDHAADAAAAVVLLTADDLGGTRSGGGNAGAEPGPQQHRARQNVVLELGYFLGALGRGKVVITYEPGVELPSDLAGVLYIALDTSGAWKNLVARELQAARVQVDLSALLSV